jgi:hypothetical protein
MTGILPETSRLTDSLFCLKTQARLPGQTTRWPLARSIKIYSLDGGDTRTIPDFGNTFVAVQWSEDGAALYCYHPGEFPSKVYRVDIATGNATVIQQLKPGVSAGVVLLAPIVVSRDGKRFAYAYNQTLSALYLIKGLH